MQKKMKAIALVSGCALLVALDASAAPPATQKVAPPATVRAPRIVGEAAAASGEDFKGAAPEHEFNFGALAGLGVVDSSGGFAIIGTAAKKILHDGWLPDVNDQIFVEIEAGPMFTSGTTVFVYGAHLRWDFIKDSAWTFYALGGVGGNITSASLGSRWEFYPRFGAGAMWSVNESITLRGELSHELMAVGISFGI